MNNFKSIFREYDIRGRVRMGEFDESNFRRLTIGFAEYLGKRCIDRVVIGFDNRKVSPGFAEIAVKIMAEKGFTVYDLGMCITPAAYFAQHYLHCSGLMMITASHNPDGWCGCKLGDGLSKTLNTAEIKELYGYCENAVHNSGMENCQGRIIGFDIRNAYIESIVEKAMPPVNDIRVVVDAGNGAAGIYAWELFQRLGYLTFSLNCEPDNTYPHYFPNPSEKTARRSLKQAVTHCGINGDVGFGFDGDGDRLGVVDEQGNDVWSDRVLMILAAYFLQKNIGGTVVFDVKCTRALIETVCGLGGRPLMWKTGHSYIKEKLKAENAVLAGERSGHIFINDENGGYDDALYAAAVLLKIMAERKQCLSEILRQFPFYSTTSEIHIPCNDEEKYHLADVMSKHFITVCGAENVCTINGARVELPQFSGWALVRASSNLPELVLIAEADGAENLDRLIAFLQDAFIANGITEEWQNV